MPELPAAARQWGGVARRGARTVQRSEEEGAFVGAPGGPRPRAPRRDAGYTPSSPPKPRDDEAWILDEGESRAVAPGRAPRPAPSGSRPRRAGEAEAEARPAQSTPGFVDTPELPADVLAELARAAGSDWGMLRERTTERLRSAMGAFERERFQDAVRMVKVVVDLVPQAASPRELLGLCQYRLGRWRAAIAQLTVAFELTGSVDQHPVLMDCERALGHPRNVERLWDELRRGSPEPDVLAEGRLVLAGLWADRGDLAKAIGVLVDAGAGRAVRNPAERHLRQWYLLADLAERAGDLPRARELFARVAEVDPEAFDVAERLRALGPIGRPRRRR